MDAVKAFNMEVKFRPKWRPRGVSGGAACFPFNALVSLNHPPTHTHTPGLVSAADDMVLGGCVCRGGGGFDHFVAPRREARGRRERPPERIDTSPAFDSWRASRSPPWTLLRQPAGGLD